MAALMNRVSRSVGFSKQQQSVVPSTRNVITRVKLQTTPETKNKQSNVEYLRSLPGITQPFPDVFDPFGLSTSTEIPDLKRWRESEIVHGRVAMLAALGFLVGEQLEDFPAFVNFDGHITGPAIGHFQQVRQGFWEPLIIAIGVAESYRVAIGWATPEGSGFNRLKDDYEPGNLGFDPLNLKPSDPEEYKIMQTKELNNGRLAMIGIAGVVAQELVDHKEVYEHLFRNVESATGIELPEAPKGVNVPDFPTVGIPKYDAPVPGPVGGKLPLPSAADIKNGVKDNLPNLPKVNLPLGFKQNADNIKQNVDNLKDSLPDVPKPQGFNFGGLGGALKNKAQEAGAVTEDIVKKSPGDLLPKEFFQGDLPKNQNLN